MIKSVRKKLFLSTALVLLVIILVLVIFNSFILRGAFNNETGVIDVYGICIAIITAVLRKYSCFFYC